MCKEQSTKFPLKQNKGSLRHLPLQSLEFQIQIRSFRQWLRVFGFANSTIYYSPVYVKSFFHFLERFDIEQMNQITNNHIRLYIHHLSGKVSDRTRQKLSQSYILNHLNAIKLYTRHLLETSGVLIDSGFRYSCKDSRARIWLMKDEVNKLYDRCDSGMPGDINRAILAVYYGMGLRRMEGIGIDISDIQWNNGLIYVKHAKFKQHRYVPMNPFVQRDLEVYNFRYRIPILKRMGMLNESALLISQHGRRLTGNAVYSRIQYLAKKARLNVPLSLHSLRHSIATHLLENGLSLENISLFLGHKSLESTQIYTHLVHKSN